LLEQVHIISQVHDFIIDFALKNIVITLMKRYYLTNITIIKVLCDKKHTKLIVKQK